MAFVAPLTYAQVGDDPPEYDERVKKLLDEKEIVYTIDSDGDFRIEFELASGRTQLGFVMSNTEEYGNFEIREIHAYAYEAPNGQFPLDVTLKFLNDTFNKKMGAWAVIDEYGVFITRIAANTDAESMYNALILTLESADEMEEELTGDADEF
jgi:hypothetical protein